MELLTSDSILTDLLFSWTCIFCLSAMKICLKHRICTQRINMPLCMVFIASVDEILVRRLGFIVRNTLIRVPFDPACSIMYSTNSSIKLSAWIKLLAKKDDYMNIHNWHSLKFKNPHAVREDRSQYEFKINLWIGILNVRRLSCRDHWMKRFIWIFYKISFPNVWDGRISIYRVMWCLLDLLIALKMYGITWRIVSRKVY